MSRESHLILVVDDDLDLRELVCQALGSEGYDVVAASNGLEALRVLEAQASPSLILLDLKMPVMNGWELCAALKASSQYADIPIVLTTGSDSPPAGAAAVMRKPFCFDRLLEIVEHWCSVSGTLN